LVPLHLAIAMAFRQGAGIIAQKLATEKCDGKFLNMQECFFMSIKDFQDIPISSIPTPSMQ
jgi:hypothetical protein